MNFIIASVLGDVLQSLVDFLSSSWTAVLTAALDLLTGNVTSVLGGAGFTATKGIHGLLVSTGTIIAVICVYLGIANSTSRLVELKNPAIAIKFFFRMAITGALVTQSLTFMVTLLTWVNSVLNRVTSYAGTSTIYALTTPDGADGIFATSDIVKEKFKKLSTGEAALANIIFVLFVVAMLAIIIMFLYIVFGRIIKIYLYMMISPLALATFGAADTSQTGKAFLRGYISLTLEAITILLSIYLTAILASSVRNLFPSIMVVNSGDSNLVGVVKYCFGSLIMAGLLISMVKGAERVTEKMIG